MTGCNEMLIRAIVCSSLNTAVWLLFMPSTHSCLFTPSLPPPQTHYICVGKAKALVRNNMPVNWENAQQDYNEHNRN